MKLETGLERLERKRCCCFTGHRQIEKRPEELSREIAQTALGLWRRGIDTFLAGGARGFDTLAAQRILWLRDWLQLPLRLVLALPCREQTKGWPEVEKRQYQAILEQADKAVYTGDSYTSGCMQRRNRFMVDHSAVCVCCLQGDRTRGGTLYTVRYAASQGLRIINLAEESPGLQPVGEQLRLQEASPGGLWGLLDV